MKNLKVYKRGVSLFTAAVVAMSLSGCRKENRCEESDKREVLEETIEETVEETIFTDFCEHLSICYGDDYFTYKECDGYVMSLKYNGIEGTCTYSIYNDNVLVISGASSEFSYFAVDHANYESEVEAVQKSKKLG